MKRLATGANSLSCTLPGTRTPKVDLLLESCLLRVAGVDDHAVVTHLPVLHESRLRAIWNTPQTIEVPADAPGDLQWRLFLYFRRWNTAAPSWTEIAPVRNQDPKSLKFIYTGNEPPVWNRSVGHYRANVQLSSVYFVVDPQGPPEAPTGFSLDLQGVPNGWQQYQSAKIAAASNIQTERAERLQLRYEVDLLQAILGRGTIIGNRGFAACLIGYETWTGPRTVLNGQLEVTDRIDVARCLLGGGGVVPIGTSMLVRPEIAATK